MEWGCDTVMSDGRWRGLFSKERTMAKPEANVILKVSVPPAMREAILLRMAAERRKNASEWVRNALEDALARGEQPQGAA
jgi:hypothetical protein